MLTADINWWAVIVSAIVGIVIGGLWYAPFLFGKIWEKEMGKMAASDAANATTGYIVPTVANLVMAYILAHFINYTNATTAGTGALTAFWLWLGFVVTAMVTNSYFESHKKSLLWIFLAMQLVVLVVSGIILAVWR